MNTVTEQTDQAFGVIDGFITAVLDGKFALFDEKVNKFFNYAQDIQFERKSGEVNTGKAEMLAGLIAVTFPI